MHCFGMMWKPKNCNKDCVYVNECTIMAEGPYKVILKTSDSKGIILCVCVCVWGGNKNYTPEGMRLKWVNKWPKCMIAT
jgi:hypothetical protein